MAAGSVLCLEYEGWYEADLAAFHEESLDGCFEMALEGVGQLQEQCLELDEPGEARVSLTRSSGSCPADLEDDSLRVRTVALDEARTTIEFQLERLLRTPGWMLEELIVPSGETLAIVEGVSVTLTMGLRMTASDEPMAWVDGMISTTAGEGAAEDEGTDLVVSLAPDEIAEIEIEVGDQAAEAVTLEAVPLSSLGAFEIVAFHGYRAEEETDEVSGFRAFARDELGRPVRGVPAKWRVVQGDVELSESTGTDPDYAFVEGPCHEPGSEPLSQATIVEAEVDGEVRSIEWLYVSQQCPSDEEEEEGDAALGCACSASGSSPGSPTWAWLCLVFLISRGYRRPTVTVISSRPDGATKKELR